MLLFGKFIVPPDLLFFAALINSEKMILDGVEL